MITDEALEAAAKAYYPHFWKPSEPVENYANEPDFIKEKVRNFVRPILEAASSHMVPELGEDTSISEISITGLSLSEAEISSKEQTRISAALGNMRTHLYIDRNKPVWVTVDKSDLEVILEHVKTLEAKLG